MTPYEVLNEKIRDTEEALDRARQTVKESPDLESARMNFRSLERWHSRLLKELDLYDNRQKRQHG